MVGLNGPGYGVLGLYVRSGVRLANLFLEIEFQALTSELSETPFQRLGEELRYSVV